MAKAKVHWGAFVAGLVLSSSFCSLCLERFHLRYIFRALTNKHAELLYAEEHTEPVKQLQLHWQHCSLSTSLDASCDRGLHIHLDTWSLLAASLAKVLPASDEFDQSDAAMMTAVAFITETLKYPFELLDRSRSAGRAWVVAVCSGDQNVMQTAKVCA